MNADVASITGSSHRICEDYGRADDNGRYVIISDGCSGSEDSDFGARLLVKQSENKILSDTNWWHDAIRNSYSCVQDLKLKPQCLDATLLSITVFDKTVKVNVYGDGVVAYKNSLGYIMVKVFEYPSGYPEYLSYNLDVNIDRYKTLKNLQNNNQRIVTEYTICPDGSINDLRKIPYLYNIFSYSYDVGISVAIMTDGVSSFIKRNENGNLVNVETSEIIRKLMDFKSLKGEFAQRSLNLLMKESVKNNWYNYDDVTIGAIVF